MRARRKYALSEFMGERVGDCGLNKCGERDEREGKSEKEKERVTK